MRSNRLIGCPGGRQYGRGGQSQRGRRRPDRAGHRCLALPDVCTKTAVTLRLPEPVLKINQYFTWALGKWELTFNKRSLSRAAAATARTVAGATRFAGVAPANLGAGFDVTSFDLRMVRNWHDRTALGTPTCPPPLPPRTSGSKCSPKRSAR